MELSKEPVEAATAAVELAAAVELPKDDPVELSAALGPEESPVESSAPVDEESVPVLLSMTTPVELAIAIAAPVELDDAVADAFLGVGTQNLLK